MGSTVARTGEKTGVTTGETGETTAGTVAADPTELNRVSGMRCAEVWSARDQWPWWLDRTTHVETAQFLSKEAARS
jgi:hypothetical protein